MLSEFVALLGSPNVGKSTLINALVGRKIAIVTKKPQTTRTRIVGVYTTPEFQIVFVDTPGIHTAKNKLSEYMVKTAETASRDVDVNVFVVDAKIGIGERDQEILSKLPRSVPLIIVINKVDAVDKTRLAHVKEQAEQYGSEILELSAKEGIGVGSLVEALKPYLKEGPQFYPEDMITDQPTEVLASEIIREKALKSIGKEIPYGIGVEIEKFQKEENRDLYHIEAVLYLERDSHKKIVIGAGGQKLKKIGTAAREDLQELLGSKVFLKLWVKVKADWRNKQGFLRSLGYHAD
ncbi:MAG: GTPase Era [Clostridia bacterium]|nr:GTPase Era [Clostridia bacterium]